MAARIGVVLFPGSNCEHDAVEAVRALVITGWDWQTIGLGFAVAGGLSILGFALATHALWNRLERT